MESGPELFVVCKSCGSEVSPYVTECPYCGARLRKRAPKVDLGDTSPGPRRRLPSMPRPERPKRRRAARQPTPRYDARPWATLAILLASIGVAIAWRSGALNFIDLVWLTGPLQADGEPWRLLSAPLTYENTGFAFIAMLAIGVFGWLLERRHGPIPVIVLFALGGPLAMLIGGWAGATAVLLGGNGIALALLCAWAVPDLLAIRRGEEVDGDLIGVLIWGLVLLAVPIAAPDADPIVGLTGVVAGFAGGRLLARISPAV